MLILLPICLIGGVIYFCCPFPIQLLLMIGNVFIPDPIPFLDEIIMVGGIISKLYFLENLSWYVHSFWKSTKKFIGKHRKLLITIVFVGFFVYKLYFSPKG